MAVVGTTGELALNYPAFVANPFNGEPDLRPLIFDVYPGTTNIVSSQNTFVSFKYDSTLVNRLTITIVKAGGGTYTAVFDNSSVPPLSQGAQFSASKVIVGNEVGIVIVPNLQITSGTSYTVSIYGDRTYLNAGQELVTFNFLVAGVPFLDKTVSGNTGLIASNIGLPLEPQLYGWSAAGNADINGDGLQDLVVSDPYFMYSASSADTDRSGIAYVYFGRIDRVNPITKGMAPDLIISNNVVGQTLYDSAENIYSPAQPLACREFGYLVKLGDINKDGYADIIIGQPAYEENKGRILIYYGGPAMANNLSTLDPTKPSVVINNSLTGKSETISPNESDLFGAMFDVGDLEGDGYADIIAKRGDSIGYINGKNIAQNAYDVRVQPYPIVLDYSVLVPAAQIIVIRNDQVPYANRDSQISFVGNFHGQNNGSNDLAISVPVSSNASYSTVYVYYGSDIVAKSIAPRHILQDITMSNCWFGWSLSAGRINNDPYMDIIVGKRTETSIPADKGKVVLFMGLE